MEVISESGEFPRDSALTAQAEDGETFGRHSTHMLECNEEQSAMLYTLGHKVAHFAVQVETHVWWNGGWQLQLHKINAHQPSKMTVGGQSLPADSPYFSKLVPIAGFDGSGTISHDASDRTHTTSESSSYPTLTCDAEGKATLICLAYCGKESPGDWKAESLDESGIVLKSEDGSEWKVSFE